MTQSLVDLIKETYLDWLSALLSNKIDGLEFQTLFMESWPDLPDQFYKSIFSQSIHEIFNDVEDFWHEYNEDDSDDRDNPMCIDEDELKRRCQIHYNNLQELVKHYTPEVNQL